MSHPPLVILGYSEASMFLRRSPRPEVAGIISIHGRREFGVEADAPHRIDLTFDDVEVPAPGDDVALYRAMARMRWAEQNGLLETSPAPSDVAAIIEFARAVQEITDAVILCHCGGGMSRAPAAALICLAVWRGPGTERECVGEVIRLRRGAVPHVGLVRFADRLLGRGGALLDAVVG
jgi:predicted protein tyrosine phosphatase